MTITAPLPYVDLIRLLKCADLVLTDSGGIQEEVVSFGVPVVVLRDVTERLEAVECGLAHLVGTDREVIFRTADWLLNERARGRPRPTRVANPFGDGHARYRVEEALAWHLGLQDQPPGSFRPDQPDAGTAVAS